jgi:hypothetical protein
MIKEATLKSKWPRRWRMLLVAGLSIFIIDTVALDARIANSGFGISQFGTTIDVGPALPTDAAQIEPVTYLPVSADEAEKLNEAVPIVLGAIVKAPAFNAGGAAMVGPSRMAALDCLAAAIYYEAASESLTGQRAVAQVVLNRVRHPAYPNSVCGVVYQGSERSTGCQFSFTCDGSLSRTPSTAGWQRALGIAAAALAGYVEPSVGTATHYHTKWVVPYWRSSLTKLTNIGAHIFYRWNGANGLPGAFNQRYAGSEPIGDPRQQVQLASSSASSEALMTGMSPELMKQIVDGVEGGGTPQAAARMAKRTQVAADETGAALRVDDQKSELILKDARLMWGDMKVADNGRNGSIAGQPRLLSGQDGVGGAE